MLVARMTSVALAGVLLLSACSKPEPPRVTPKEARVVAVGPQGVAVTVKVEATNPNRFTLAARSVTGKAKLDGRWELGTVTVNDPITLPPSIPTTLDVPMTLPWTDMQALAALAMTPKPVTFVVDGKVTVGGEQLNVDVPFQVSGTITREQLVNAALKGLPSH